MTKEYRQFTSLLAWAAAQVPQAYFQLPVAGLEDPIYRERVYCYEVYHQLQRRWLFPDLSFSGEIDKTNHPLIRGNELDRAKPDFIVHRPGDMQLNFVVIEVKPANVNRDDLQKDLVHLTGFRRYANYKHAFLVYGGTTERLQQIKNTSRSIAVACGVDRVSLDMIELWWHGSPGTEATIQGWEPD
jgi:hypothetical protein